MEQKKIGLFIRKLRKEKGLTQERLAEKLGVTNRSISRWENGVNMPDLDLLIELADYFDVSIDDLLDGERQEAQMDKKTEETILKVADYSNEEKRAYTKRLNLCFIAGIVAFVVYMVLEMQGLTDTGVYEDIASFSLGIVLGMLLVGAVYTSRYMRKIQAFKQRLLGRYKRGHSN